MKHTLKRIACLTLMFLLVFNTTVFADEGPHDYEDDSTPAPEIDFSAPSDTSFDDTVWTIEYEDGTEELYQPNPNARWMLLACCYEPGFSVSWKSSFCNIRCYQNTSYDIKIVTKLQSYRNGAWKTLYTKTKTTTISSGTISGSYYVTKGYKYRTRNTITVYNASGKVIEQDTLNCTRTYN